MSEMKTLKFPGDTEPREIVDAGARERLNALETNGSSGTGLTAEEKSKILTLFQNAAYTADMSETIDALAALWGIEAAPETYSVTNKLTNVVSSNSAASVTEGDSYTAQLTAEDGYAINSVSVTMGGTDVTESVYADGVVTISNVTGSIVITATAISTAATTYTITNHLTHVTSSNAAVSVEEGTAYSATLTAVEGYKLDAVTVTMGGTDITSTAYADGKITIASVTGDVVVTAAAVAKTVYTITNNLTNVTNSNAAASVEEGGSYSATLTVDDGYALESLAITMGGLDVTDTVYAEGYILITEVTGDVVITAAAKAQAYIGMNTGVYSDTISIYSDDDKATLLKTLHYQSYSAHSLCRTETEASVKVVFANNTEADISGTMYVGDMREYPVKANAISLNNGVTVGATTIRAGGSVEFEYTLKAGRYLFVAGVPANIEVSAIGALDIHEPVAEFATEYKYADTVTTYSDGGDTVLSTSNYVNTTFTTETFSEDTVLRISIVGPRSLSLGFFGSCDPATPHQVYYGYSVLANGSRVAEGGIAVLEHTVKAGYAFAWVSYKDAVYVEKA